MTDADITEKLRGLRPADLALYRYAVEHPGFRASEAEPGSVHALCAAGLLRACADGRWEPVDPRTAGASVVTAEARLRRDLAGLGDARATLDALGELYAARAVEAPLESVESVAAVLPLIEEAAAAARTEVLVTQPDRAWPLDELALARRGVRVRLLHHHTARYHAPTQERVAELVGAGAAARTLAEPGARMLAFDRRVVLLPHTAGGAVVVRDPSTVAFLCDAFDRGWNLASPYNPCDPRAEVRTEVQSAILAMLSEGLRDETIARRLGVSLRTCRKYIAEIFELLGAESRFQAGYLTRAKQILRATDGAPG
ncbi:LuxR C-terminal-related transcriptional regulator [Kitasatospora sp. NPDC058170]|uniref:helix-turn-helix transcriptional regulator n=1 Tax=Kitasatospora sp. NPDC058170 TaxID=3346364 RepID=UPI0036D9E4A7